MNHTGNDNKTFYIRNIPNKETLKAMEETDRGNVKIFDSFEEMMEDLEK